MISHLSLTSPVWTAVGWTMLHVLWIGGAIGLMAAFPRRRLTLASPETRYGIALCCLLALAVSPVLVFAIVLNSDSRSAVDPRRSSLDTVGNTVSVSGRARQATGPLIVRSRPTERPTIASARSRLRVVVDLLPWVWLGGSISTLLLVATGLIGIDQLRRSSEIVVSGELYRRAGDLAESLGLADCVSIGICDRLAAPILIGIVRPLILLPSAAITGWSAQQLEMVLLHELAHLKRWDNLVNLIQRFVESLLFFHPVVWWLSAWIRLERELCCDRFVVERVGAPLEYAEMLLVMAGSGDQRHRPALAMADRQVLTRIRRLFKQEERSMKLTMAEGLGSLGALAIGLVIAFGLQAAQVPKVSDPQANKQKIPIPAGDATKDQSVPKVQLEPEPASHTGSNPPTRRSNRLDPRSARRITIFRRDERQLEIVQLPKGPDGVTTYRCRGGIKIVLESLTLGTIRMEADEAVIKRADGHWREASTGSKTGETWIDAADQPMEVHFEGNVVFHLDQGKTGAKSGQITFRASELDFDFLNGRLVGKKFTNIVLDESGRPESTITASGFEFSLSRTPDNSSIPAGERNVGAGGKNRSDTGSPSDKLSTDKNPTGGRP